MSNVIYINGAQQSNAVQIDPDEVLNKAIGEYESILMIGYNKAGGARCTRVYKHNSRRIIVVSIYIPA